MRAREQIAALRELAEAIGVTLTEIDEAPGPPGIAIHECGTARRMYADHNLATRRQHRFCCWVLR
jgi:hypothetical protein